MPSPESPRIIISDGSTFEIISPQNNRRLFVNIGPNNTVTTRIEPLTSRDEQKLAAETYLTETARHLIHSMLELDAARLASGSEVISPDLSVIAYQGQFVGAVQQLARMGYLDRSVQKLIQDQGRLITLGEEHMGEMPTIVREKVFALSNQVPGIYLDMARKSRLSRANPVQIQQIPTP